MEGYYTKDEIIEACKGLSGMAEVVKRGDVWQHPYPPHNTPEIHVITTTEYMQQTVYIGHEGHGEELLYAELYEGFEYYDMIGTRRKIINVDDAPDYPMLRRW